MKMNAEKYRAFLFGDDLTKNHKAGATQILAPLISEISDKYLFEEIWQDETLSLRERQLVTISTMVSLGHSRELGFHILAALKHGINKQEIVSTIVNQFFYIGLPLTHNALRVALEQFKKFENEF